ncbi:MAG: O-acetyl-ADP-ribose deacetylase [Chloroflexi bacterium]|nr:O-acetyl-ADP-ribose deacetylase [Chloroflexota bacterium]
MAAEITIGAARILLVQGDITGEKVQAIVNAANSGLMGGGGVDGAIHRAGGAKIKEECQAIVSRIGRLPAGRAVITGGGNLAAKYVIHTVGPVWRGGDRGEAETLASCYRESLKLANSGLIKSIAFPAISTGVYGYPPEEAAKIAVNTVIGFLSSGDTSIELVEFVLYDANSFNIYQRELKAEES